MAFLPQGYTRPEPPSNYLKFKTGDNKFRILSEAMTGWLDWSKEKKPIRTPEKPSQFVDPAKPAKHFWAMVVWDYATKAIKVLEITQATIQGAIQDLAFDENWGDPTGYDLNVKKTGEKMETEYSVIPAPPKPLHPEIARLHSEAKVNLNALWSNGDPFAGSEGYVPPMTEPTTVDSDEIRVEDIPF